MLTDADSEGLLRDILDDPEDDGPRLIYADWLEEHDQPDRAEFIRVQVEKAHLEAVRGAPPGRGPCTCAGLAEAERPCRWHQLAFREDRLHEEHYAEWERAAGLVLDLPQGRQWLTRQVTWRRGFVERVALGHRDFLRHAGRLFGHSPITGVGLTDKRPLRRGGPGSWSWLHGPGAPTARPWLKSAGQELHRDPWVISRPLWDRLRGTAGPSANEKVYGLEQEADDDLARACVAYGREEAEVLRSRAGWC
jgi:uncharacterized protein (TIGR02996 family)